MHRAAAIPNQEFWTGRPVRLMGHTGFKGSWLSLWLHRSVRPSGGFIPHV
jgi:CDP-glucose 4,6-dehydratase